MSNKIRLNTPNAFATILICEDQKANFFIIKEILTKNKEALERCEPHNSRETRNEIIRSVWYLL